MIRLCNDQVISDTREIRGVVPPTTSREDPHGDAVMLALWGLYSYAGAIAVNAQISGLNEKPEIAALFEDIHDSLRGLQRDIDDLADAYREQSDYDNRGAA